MVVLVDISAAKEDTGSLTVSGEPEALSGTVSRGGLKIKMISPALAGKNIALVFAGDSLGYAGWSA